ncbi:MAG: 3D domain-containing protein [Phycisphaeraceae bacterium]|nr:3D domain-containing protein [Phycisphaeraceae bacterium]
MSLNLNQTRPVRWLASLTPDGRRHVAAAAIVMVVCGLLATTGWLVATNVAEGARPTTLMRVAHVATADQAASAERGPTVADLLSDTAPRASTRIVNNGSQPMFNGRPLRKARTIRMLVTAYSPDERSCGKWADGKTSSGYSVWTNGMKLVAADTRLLPFKSIITVPGYNGGKPVPVLDRGGAIKGRRLDVLYPTHEIARGWGKQWLEVTVWEYAD